jgi:flagellar hook-length control protein FliK
MARSPCFFASATQPSALAADNLHMKAFTSFVLQSSRRTLSDKGSPTLAAEPRRHTPFSVTLQEVMEEKAGAASKEHSNSLPDSKRDTDHSPERMEPVPMGPLMETPPREGPVSAPADVSGPAGTPDEIHRLAQQILKGVSVEQVGQQTTLRMELSTPRLPRVGVDLSLDAGRVSARFSVLDQASRELLRAATSELEAGLQAKGLGRADIHVDLKEATDLAPGDGDGGRSAREHWNDEDGATKQHGPGKTPLGRRESSTSYIV